MPNDSPSKNRRRNQKGGRLGSDEVVEPSLPGPHRALEENRDADPEDDEGRASNNAESNRPESLGSGLSMPVMPSTNEGSLVPRRAHGEKSDQHQREPSRPGNLASNPRRPVPELQHRH